VSVKTGGGPRLCDITGRYGGGSKISSVITDSASKGKIGKKGGWVRFGGTTLLAMGVKGRKKK